MEFYRTVVERLEPLAKKARLELHLDVASSHFDWMKPLLINPGVKQSFYLEGDKSAMVGMIVVPDPERKQSNKAWNRFDAPLPTHIEKLELDGYEGKRIAVVVIQVWERLRATVLIPARELRRTKTYRDTGTFTVVNNGGEFRIQTVRYEPEIKLKDKLEYLSSFLP